VKGAATEKSSYKLTPAQKKTRVKTRMDSSKKRPHRMPGIPKLKGNAPKEREGRQKKRNGRKFGV